MYGVEGREHHRRIEDVDDAQDADQTEEHHHHGTEEGRHLGGAGALDREQRDEDHDRDGQDVGNETCLGDTQPLDGRENRDGRRDDGIARKQRRSRDAEKEHRPAPFADRMLGERHQRQGTAFAFVIGAHQEQNVFRRHGDQQRPDEKRDDPDHLALVDGGSSVLQGSLQRVQRACPDIAVDHTDRAQRQLGHILPSVRMGRCCGMGRGGIGRSAGRVGHGSPRHRVSGGRDDGANDSAGWFLRHHCAFVGDPVHAAARAEAPPDSPYHPPREGGRQDAACRPTVGLLSTGPEIGIVSAMTSRLVPPT